MVIVTGNYMPLGQNKGFSAQLSIKIGYVITYLQDKVLLLNIKNIFTISA